MLLSRRKKRLLITLAAGFMFLLLAVCVDKAILRTTDVPDDSSYPTMTNQEDSAQPFDNSTGQEQLGEELYTPAANTQNTTKLSIGSHTLSKDTTSRNDLNALDDSGLPYKQERVGVDSKYPNKMAAAHETAPALSADKSPLAANDATDYKSYNSMTNQEKTVALTNAYINSYITNGKNHGPEWLKTTDFSFYWTEDNKPIYSVDTVQPFGKITNQGQFWFWEGRYAHASDMQNTANLGVGWRKLSKDKTSMIGFNTFYDYGFQYNLERLGVGVEYFNKLAEYRVNWYKPLSDDRLINVEYETDGILYSYIRAVEGFDFEGGTSFNHLPWLKVFAGGYYWDNKHHEDELGYRLRSTMKLNDRVNMELGYLNSNTSHSFYGKLYYHLAFDSNKKQKDQQKEASIDLSDKLLQKVERQNDIKTETYSKFVAYQGNIQVTVTNSTNNTVINGVTVQAYKNGKAVGKSATTNSSGIATISGLDVGTYTVYATYGTATNTSSAVTVTKDTTVDAAVTLAVSGGSATVTVTDTAGDAVSGATVTASSSSVQVTTTTDTSGDATFTNLPAGSYTFTATSGGDSITTQTATVSTDSTTTVTTTLPTSGGNVQVTVTDSSSNLVSGATVTLTSNGTTVATGTTASNGVALLSGITAGTYTVSASSTGYDLNSTKSVDVTTGQTSTATLTMTIKDETITVVDNYQWAIPYFTFTLNGSSYQTDANGQIVVSSLSPGTYTLTDSTTTSGLSTTITVTTARTMTVTFPIYTFIFAPTNYQSITIYGIYYTAVSNSTTYYYLWSSSNTFWISVTDSYGTGYSGVVTESATVHSEEITY